MTPINLSQSLISAFATPIVNRRLSNWPQHNGELGQLIKEAQLAGPGLSKSNVGGWHSELGFLNQDAEATTWLKREVTNTVLALQQQFTRSASNLKPPTDTPNLRIESWANALRFGQYNTLHSHPNATWSGVYYLADNETINAHPFSGKFEFTDPRPGASIHYQEGSNLYGRFLVNPNAGQLLMFPSWLEHMVHPYFGQGERLSIAFNIHME